MQNTKEIFGFIHEILALKMTRVKHSKSSNSAWFKLNMNSIYNYFSMKIFTGILKPYEVYHNDKIVYLYLLFIPISTEYLISLSHVNKSRVIIQLPLALMWKLIIYFRRQFKTICDCRTGEENAASIPDCPELAFSKYLYSFTSKTNCNRIITLVAMYVRLRFS